MSNSLWPHGLCSLQGSSVHGILQVRILACVAILFSRGSFWPRDQTQVSYISGIFLTVWATRENHINIYMLITSYFAVEYFLLGYSEISSVQFSRSVVSDYLQPHEPQHARPPCPSPTPGAYPNSCPSSRQCHLVISSSVVPFSCLQSLPASGSFAKSQLFTWGGQSIGASASTSVLPMNTQDWSPLGWTGWTSLQSKALSRVFSNTTVQKHQFFSTQLSSRSNSHIHTWPLEKPYPWLYRPLLIK